MSGSGNERVHGLVDHLFRRESARLVAALTRSFGPAHLDLVDEVVQEALLQALRRWPFHGVPDEPAAWLYRVARNLALDRLRRETSFRGKERQIRETLEAETAPPAPVHLASEISDDQLRTIFLCCHPELPQDARVALTLKTVVGFGVDEIARGFLAKPATIAQRLVRAQRRIRELDLPFEMPPRSALPERLDAVLEVIYLMFNEGYASRGGDELIRADLCREALRLVSLLAGRDDTGVPTVHALGALLSFQASRLPARVDADGNLVLLDRQNRSLWDADRIRAAFAHLDRASEGDRLTPYHVEAAIAAHHASAGSDADTDWAAILALYDTLLELNPSPVVALNRAVALAEVEGPEAGLAALAQIDGHPAIAEYYLLPATLGELRRQLGDREGAASAYRTALELPCSDPERRFLLRRLMEL